MAKPIKNKGKPLDGHKIVKGKSGKRNDKHKINKVNKGHASFKNKQNKFSGKKTKTFSKGGKFVPKKVANEKMERTEVIGKTNPQKRKLSKSTDDNIKDVPTKTVKKSDATVAYLMSIYEKLRVKNTSKEEKSKLIEEVLKMCAEKEHEVIHKHGTVRVLEMSVKYGTPEQRKILFEIYDKNMMELVTSKYAKFLVQKFIEYGSKEQKRKIIESFYGHVKKLIRHKGASSIVDDIYDRYADSNQKAALSEEFYGPEISIFKSVSGLNIEEIFKSEPLKKASVLKHMKEQLDVLCQKEVITHSIIHTALHNFFKIANQNDKLDVISLLKEKIVHIVHTRDGANVAMNCIWFSNAKDRKAIVKTFKTFVVKICKEEYGHLVMLALFDVVDDTVLIKKLIIPEIISSLEELMLNMYGRKVLLYLLKPRSPSYFAPNTIKLLQEGDSNPHSKKDRSIRGKELCDAIIPNMIEVLKKELKDIIYNKSVAIVLLALLDVAVEVNAANELLEELAKLVGKPEKSNENDCDGNKDGDKKEHPVYDACGHWVIKRIIQQDKNRSQKGQTVLFSVLLCDAVPKGCFADWASTNRGAFVLVSLMETDIAFVKKRVKADMKFLKVKETSNGLEVLQKLL